ncbi:putative bifunctional diguanylate cyclase/phosphodiesterase [Gilvimarinus sp. F26214L]|uniref:putative bifunctional diguanylate cyclase/phosphodiesterase n=1 Tax=Gilvimarinus sp. DZF01 TaxID=3461371 RepID=UPI0040457FA1
MGLRKKLLLLWFVLLLSPLAILGSIGYVYIDAQLRQDALDYQTDLLHSVSSVAGIYFTLLREGSRRTAARSELSAFVSGSPGDGQTATAILRRQLDRNPAAQAYWVLKGDQALLTVGRSGLSLPVSPEALARPQGDQPHIQFLPAAGEAGGYMVSVAPIPGGSAEGRPAFLAVFASYAALERLVASRPTREAQLLLVDRGGNVLTQRDAIDFPRLPDFAQLVPGEEVRGRVADNFRLRGKQYLLAMNRLSDDFWLVSLTDKAEIFANKRPYIVIFVTALGLTLILSGAVFTLVVDDIAIKPVQKLIRATRQIAKGDLNPELDIRSDDELGELALSFRQMGRQLYHTSRRIRQLAYFDSLTQLPNRTTLRETLSRLLAQSDRANWKIAVLFIDLDDFKKVNDRLGHEAGDELLIQISQRLKDRLRQADLLFGHAGVVSVDQLISRRGGDEFNAILTCIRAAHDAAVVAERIIQDLNEPFVVHQSEIHVGASVGIALFPDDGTDADTLLRNADLAMYEAKAKGKNNYHIFTSAINDQVHQRLALENSLQAAMVHSQFRLYYQPKVSLVDMSPVGFEALVRWQHPEQGVILPSHFIPVAEESNLIRDIGNWVLAESMQQIQLWDRLLPRHLRIAINISARQLAQTDLVDQLRMMIEHFAISPQRLEIELTETSVLQDEAMAVQHLSDLRALGVEISLDDFGTGYSSLSFLRKLPIDTVKIDRSFTANVVQNSEARAIVISLLKLCKELNVKTIAEGIETTEQLQFLMEHGCDQGQGFLFSRPLPSHEVLAFLEKPSYLALS